MFGPTRQNFEKPDSCDMVVPQRTASGPGTFPLIKRIAADVEGALKRVFCAGLRSKAENRARAADVELSFANVAPSLGRLFLHVAISFMIVGSCLAQAPTTPV